MLGSFLLNSALLPLTLTKYLLYSFEQMIVFPYTYNWSHLLDKSITFLPFDNLWPVSAKLSNHDAQALYDVVTSFGFAFQLQDDMLDVWGNPATFGKEVGGDIMNNKKTYLLINAIGRAQGDDALELRHWLNDPCASHDEKFPAVRAIYERLGLRQLSRQAIDRYTTQSLQRLDDVAMSDEARGAFVELINRLVNREK